MGTRSDFLAPEVVDNVKNCSRPAGRLTCGQADGVLASYRSASLAPYPGSQVSNEDRACYRVRPNLAWSLAARNHTARHPGSERRIDGREGLGRVGCSPLAQ
jgi:hypothetical protein